MLAHNVYFTLSDASPQKQQQLIDACHQYLKEHPGVVFFAVGTLEPELARPVNDRDFHVAVHVVFDSRSSHDTYQVSETHQKFIAENKENWAGLRVFDSIVTG